MSDTTISSWGISKVKDFETAEAKATEAAEKKKEGTGTEGSKGMICSAAATLQAILSQPSLANSIPQLAPMGTPNQATDIGQKAEGENKPGEENQSGGMNVTIGETPKEPGDKGEKPKPA